jgi:hypothetical protein
VSRREMWKMANKILQMDSTSSQGPYSSIKADSRLENRRLAKAFVTEALSGWVKNEEDELFTLEDPTKLITKQ